MSTVLTLGEIKDDAAASSALNNVITTTNIVIISKSTCPFCLEAKSLLDTLAVAYTVIETDKEPSCDLIRANLARRTKQKTVPYVYIAGNLIGGCDDLKALHAKGELKIMLSDVIKSSSVPNEDLQRYISLSVADQPSKDTSQPQNPPEQEMTAIELKEDDTNTTAEVPQTNEPTRKFHHILPALFSFPATVDNNVVRISGALSMCVCITIIAAAAAEETWADYLALGLWIDFLLRFYGGAAVSPLGAFSTLLASPFVPEFSAGPPKQFALLCGVFFAGIGTLGLFYDVLPLGILFFAFLLIANFLQSFVDFCLACFFFGLAIKFKLLDSSVYRVHLDEKPEKLPAWTRQNAKAEFKSFPESFPQKGDSKETVLRTTGKTDDEKWFAFSLIKNCHLEYFMAPLALAALAFLWFNLEELDRYPYVPDDTWVGIWVLSLILFITLFVAYVCKLFLYFSKVRKEYLSPGTGHLILAIPTTFCIYASLSYEQGGNEESAKNLWWTGAVLTSLFTVLKMSELLFQTHSQEHVTPLWLTAAVSNLVAGVTSLTLTNGRFPELANKALYYQGTGFILTLILLPPLLLKSITDHHSDDRTRPALNMFVVAIAFSGVLFIGSVPILSVYFFYGAFTLSMVLFTGWLRNFFGYPKFSMENWGFAFSSAALAFNAITVDTVIGDLETQNLVYLTSTIATFVASVCGILTLREIAKLQLFVPRPKFGPLSFMKLTHEAFREHVPKLVMLVDAIGKDKKKDKALVAQLTEEFLTLVRVHDIHSKHEEHAIFPMLEKFAPGIANSASHQHEDHHIQVAQIAKYFDLLSKEVSNTKVLEDLKSALKSFGDDILAHLRWEERSVSVCVSKLVPVDMQKEIIRKVDNVTSYQEWTILLRWTIENLKIEYQRVKYIRTLVWAMPEKAQLFGAVVYRTCLESNYVKLASQIPEMIPRGLPGHVKYF